MGRLASSGVTMGLLCVAATVAVAGPKGGFFAPGGTAPHSPEIMLYFSHSIGAGAGASHPTFALRLQQVHQAANSGDPLSGDPMQHRQILSWQMQPHANLRMSDMRLSVGSRVTFDLSNRRFGLPPRAAMQLSAPTLRNAPANVNRGGPMFARDSTSTPGTRDRALRDAPRDNVNLHEIATAAMSAIAPARFTAVQRNNAQRQGGLAALAAAERARANVN